MLPKSASFKYLGFVFYESGSVLPAFAKLTQNGKGAPARLRAKHKAKMCSKSFPIMRRLFGAVVRPTVSGEVWAPACYLALSLELKDRLEPNGLLLSALPTQKERHSQHHLHGVF